MMRQYESGTVRAGWRLLWQTQRVMWWVYAVNLVLGFLSAAGWAFRVGSVLDHSLAAQRLYHGFDLATFLELAAHPDVQLATRPMSSLGFAVLFFIFMMFATGGILESYARNRMLVPGEFFQGCGAFFWRFVRLVLWFLVVLAPIMMLAGSVQRWSDRLASDAAPEKLGLWMEVVGLLVVALLLMSARLWFDMAQTIAVVEDERGMTRTLGRAFKLTFANFLTLFWMYLRLSIIAWVGTVAAIYVWAKYVPAERIGMAFLLGQFTAWLWIATRLWQRASEVTWYQRQRPAPALVNVEEPAAHPAEQIQSIADQQGVSAELIQRIAQD